MLTLWMGVNSVHASTRGPAIEVAPTTGYNKEWVPYIVAEKRRG